MNHQSQPNKSSLVADINTPLLYNFWYVAGFTSDFSRDLVERTFLNRSIVFYRTAKKNELVALQNRCAHRSYPLAKSRLEGDDIRCGYHGAKFNPAGEIIEIPCQDKCRRFRPFKNIRFANGVHWFGFGWVRQVTRMKAKYQILRG